MVQQTTRPLWIVNKLFKYKRLLSVTPQNHIHHPDKIFLSNLGASQGLFRGFVSVLESFHMRTLVMPTSHGPNIFRTIRYLVNDGLACGLASSLPHNHHSLAYHLLSAQEQPEPIRDKNCWIKKIGLVCCVVSIQL